MSVWSAIFLGLIQGVAEFLPISSSGHLSFFQNFLGLADVESDFLFFDVLLHLGTLAAVIIAYWSDIVEIFKEFIAMCRSFGKGGGKTTYAPPARRMILLLIVATLPLLIVLPIKDRVETLYSNTVFIGFAFMATGLILFLADRLRKGQKTEANATIVDAVVVGCAQALAVVPGLSRSGTTIAAGMTRGFDRTFAVKFSFLLSLPAVLGANLLSLIDAIKEGIEWNPVYLLGVLVAAISGYFSIRLLKFVSKKGSFGGFSYYCWLIGLVTIFLSLIK